jgi:hypothetical protein
MVRAQPELYLRHPGYLFVDAPAAGLLARARGESGVGARPGLYLWRLGSIDGALSLFMAAGSMCGRTCSRSSGQRSGASAGTLVALESAWEKWGGGAAHACATEPMTAARMARLPEREKGGAVSFGEGRACVAWGEAQGVGVEIGRVAG